MIPHQCPHPYHQKQARRRIERNSLVAMLLLLVLSFIAGRVSLKSIDDYRLENAGLITAINQLKKENKALLKQQDFIQSAQKIDLQAKQESRRALTELHGELSDIKEQLAFYQRVVAPETLVKGLYVNSLEIKALSAEGTYLYQLVLAQGASQKRVLKGRYEVIISGELNGKDKHLDLSELVDGQVTAGYSFRYYQLLSAEFKLPSGFVAKRIKLIIKPSKKGKAVIEVERTWSEIIDEQ